MQLLPRPDTDDLRFAIGGQRLGEIDDAHARDLRDHDLAAPHVLESLQNELDPLAERDPKPGHAGVGDRDGSGLTLGHEKRNDTAARADHVAVADDRELGAVETRQ